MKQTDYNELIAEIKALIEDIAHPIANYANVSAALWRAMDGVNWDGFYLLDEDGTQLNNFDVDNILKQSDPVHE